MAAAWWVTKRPGVKKGKKNIIKTSIKTGVNGLGRTLVLMRCKVGPLVAFLFRAENAPQLEARLTLDVANVSRHTSLMISQERR